MGGVAVEAGGGVLEGSSLAVRDGCWKACVDGGITAVASGPVEEGNKREARMRLWVSRTRLNQLSSSATSWVTDCRCLRK